VFYPLLVVAMISVTHATGWSDPVISLETPDLSWQLKDIEVTDGDHVHQIWYGFDALDRIGRNTLLPDGTVFSPDVLLSRQQWSAYCTSCLLDTDVFGVWREASGSIWYALNDHLGNPLIPATWMADAPWATWWYVAADGDSLGHVHMTYEAPGGVWYSVLAPGTGELRRDTIPSSRAYTLLDVNGDRVHILYDSDGGDYLPRYVQYDLNGDQTIGPVSLFDPTGPLVLDRWSMCSDNLGNACIILRRNYSNSPLLFFRIDGNTGGLLVDEKQLYQPPSGVNADNMIILPGPDGTILHLLWAETESGTVWHKQIRHAVIDPNGDFIIDPYTAYDYTDEDQEDLKYMAATMNEAGDIFVNYSEWDQSIQLNWIRLGWFDHNWLGIGDGGAGTTEPDLELIPSCNPFSASLTITCSGSSLPGRLMVYDIMGRLIRSLSDREDSSFLWDGRDETGLEAPLGVYLIRGSNEAQVSCITALKM
jgi:hypothetical protein